MGVLYQFDHFQLPRVDIDLGKKCCFAGLGCFFLTFFCFYNFGSLREAGVPQIAFRSPSSEVVIGIPVPSVDKSTNPSGDKSGR